MMVKDVTKFHKRHLGGRGILECVCCVCVRRYTEFLVLGGGTPKFDVDVEGVCNT